VDAFDAKKGIKKRNGMAKSRLKRGRKELFHRHQGGRDSLGSLSGGGGVDTSKVKQVRVFSTTRRKKKKKKQQTGGR